jgi:hypothetical protein
MKTNYSLAITFVLLQISATLLAQPCNDQAAKTTKGIWRETKNNTYVDNNPKVTSALIPILSKKAQQLRSYMVEAYPNPIGCVVGPKTALINYPNVDFKKGAGYYFEMSIFTYYCNKTTNKVEVNEYTGSTGALIYINSFRLFLDPSGGKGEEFEIDGKTDKVFLLPRKTGNIKGHTVFQLPGSKYVLYTQNGKFPFTTISREQYLNALLKKIGETSTNLNSQMDENEALLVQMLADADKEYEGEVRDQMKAELERGLEEMRKQKKSGAANAGEFVNEETKEIQKYLDTHSKEELLQPACVRETGVFRGFITEEEGGQYLVVRNENYINSSLSNDLAQMIIVEWTTDQTGIGNDFEKQFEAQFPFEKIQALIGK